MTPLLSARQLTKQYGGRNGCHDVSFDLYPGEVLCIVGESGSGKTTLLNTLALRTEADSGELSYINANGETLDLRALSEPRRRLPDEARDRDGRDVGLRATGEQHGGG